MGVQLNIKDRQTVELARSLAASLGKTVTDTVREALEEKRERHAQEVADRIRSGMALARSAGKLWKATSAGCTSKELMDALYDDRGLPA